jgi:hypothetical protein
MPLEYPALNSMKIELRTDENERNDIYRNINDNNNYIPFSKVIYLDDYYVA